MTTNNNTTETEELAPSYIRSQLDRLGLPLTILANLMDVTGPTLSHHMKKDVIVGERAERIANILITLKHLKNGTRMVPEGAAADRGGEFELVAGGGDGQRRERSAQPAAADFDRKAVLAKLNVIADPMISLLNFDDEKTTYLNIIKANADAAEQIKAELAPEMANTNNQDE